MSIRFVFLPTNPFYTSNQETSHTKILKNRPSEIDGAMQKNRMSFGAFFIFYFILVATTYICFDKHSAIDFLFIFLITII